MLRWQHTAKGGSSNWNMQSDHRAIRLTLPQVNDIRNKKRWTTPKKRELAKPSDFGALVEASVQQNPPTNIQELDHMFSETAKAMPKAAPRKKQEQDPRIQALINERKQLPRSPDGRQRFKITAEIRKLIRKDCKKRRDEAINAAFSKNTNWAKIAQEWRINRTEATPVFTIEGNTTTSDKEAIEAITKHIQGIYAKPKKPTRIPEWNKEHGRTAINLSEAIGIAARSAKSGKATDESGLSNACIKSIREEVVQCIAEVLQRNTEKNESLPNHWKQARGLLLHKKRRQGEPLKL
jgi:hypothetical protein